MEWPDESTPCEYFYSRVWGPLTRPPDKKDLESHKNESSKYKEIGEYTSNLTYTSPFYEKPLLEADKDLAEKREAWHTNLKKDIYVNEALNVLSELKLKPQYELVKN